MLSMVILVLISFLEVAIYSYLINPGKDLILYEKHAEITAPYISGIFGFVLFFLLNAYWTKKNYTNAAKLSLILPLTYLCLDLTLLLSVGNIDWSEFILIFILANGAKFLGSILGHRAFRNKVQAS